MSKKESAHILEMDKRILVRRLLAGEYLENEVQMLLMKLPDSAENAEEVSLADNEE